MSGVEQISRSAADELYNLTHSDMHVDLINIEPFVEKMLSAVTKVGSFLANTMQAICQSFIVPPLAACNAN